MSGSWLKARRYLFFKMVRWDGEILSSWLLVSISISISIIISISVSVYQWEVGGGFVGVSVGSAVYATYKYK